MLLQSQFVIPININHYRIPDIHINIYLFHRSPRNPKIHQCLICRKFHSLRYCKRFIAMSVLCRRRAVRRHGYCWNCLARSHQSAHCSSKDVCQRCEGTHHTMLHLSVLKRIHNGDQQQNQRRQQEQQTRRRQRQQSQSERQRQHQPNHRLLEQRRSQSQEQGRERRFPSLARDSAVNTHPRHCLKEAMRALQRLQKAI